MNSLIIDTSTKYLYIALVQDDKILAERIFEGSKNHAGNSVYQIDLMLKEHNLKTSDLDNVYCGYGPGSYTGVRISVTIAKMLASFSNINLYGISSLYLAGSGYDNKNVAVMFDARRGNSFCACFGELEIQDKLRSNVFMNNNNAIILAHLNVFGDFHILVAGLKQHLHCLIAQSNSNFKPPRKILGGFC